VVHEHAHRRFLRPSLAGALAAARRAHRTRAGKRRRRRRGIRAAHFTPRPLSTLYASRGALSCPLAPTPLGVASIVPPRAARRVERPTHGSAAPRLARRRQGFSIGSFASASAARTPPDAIQ